MFMSIRSVRRSQSNLRKYKWVLLKRSIRSHRSWLSSGYLLHYAVMSACVSKMSACISVVWMSEWLPDVTNAIILSASHSPLRIATCNSSASCSSCCDTIPTISSSCDASSSDRRASYHWCPRNASNRSTGSNNYYNGSLWSRNLRNGGFRWKFCGMRHMRNLWILYRTLLCAKDKKLTTEGVVNLLRH